VPASVKNFDLETGLSDNPVVFWTYGANAVEIEVDMETGHIDVLKVASCWDVGKVINPTLIEGQIEGAILQGIGSALYEELQLVDEIGRAHVELQSRFDLVCRLLLE